MSVQMSFVFLVSRLLVLRERGKESVQELSPLLIRRLNCRQWCCLWLFVGAGIVSLIVFLIIVA